MRHTVQYALVATALSLMGCGPSPAPATPSPPPPPPGSETPAPATPSPDPAPGQACAPAGCSSTVCADAAEASNIVTTCEFRPEYACYRDATCERQPGGECGWTQTPELSACLANPPTE